MKIAFIGLGDIGSLIASHLAREPFELTVWNRTTVKAEEFARNHKASVAANPAEAVRDAAAVITCLPSSVEVEAVLHGENGIIDAMRKGSVLIDCTSGDPPTSRSIAAELGGRGVEFIDAPVSGGTTAARAGTLTVMWGGEITVFERVRLVVEAFGKKIVHGRLGRRPEGGEQCAVGGAYPFRCRGAGYPGQGRRRSKGRSRRDKCVQRPLQQLGEPYPAASPDARISQNVQAGATGEGHRHRRRDGGGPGGEHSADLADRRTVPSGPRKARRERRSRRSGQNGGTGKRLRNQVMRGRSSSFCD